jgi:peptidoglycan/LPS O-acetylase OafA/YrhL
VDVFFVISGFLITSLLLRELSASGRISIPRFYARRALRLLPAATLVGLATLAGAWLFLSKVRFHEFTVDALYGIFYAENLRLAGTETDYLAQDTPPSPFQHFWSLAVEEQFYLLWPLLLLLSWRLTRGRWGPLAVLCLASFWLSVSLTEPGPASWAYFGTHTRLWELGVGSLLAFGAARLARLPGALTAAMTWLGLAGIVLAAVRFDETTPFPGHHALLPVLGTALVLAGGCAPARGDARLVLARRPAVWLGGLSYGWYLWHWPLLLIGPEALALGGLALSLALAGVALVLAWLTFHLVENPVRFHAAFRRRPRRALGLGAGLMAGAAALTLTAAAFPPAIGTGPPAPRLAEALDDAPDPEQRLAELLQAPPRQLPSNLTPWLDAIGDRRSALYRDDCHAGFGSRKAQACVYGDRSSEEVVVLFGDSHAAQWFPALQRLANENGWKLVTLTKASCKVPAMTMTKNGNPYVACDAWRADALSLIDDLDPDLVIAASSDAGKPVDEVQDTLQGRTDGFRETFETLRRGGAEEVAFLLDTPWPTGDAVDCAASHSEDLTSCTQHLADASPNPQVSEAARAAADATGGVSVIDPAPWLCDTSGECPVVVGNALVYRDTNHLSETYAAAIAPVLGARLTAQ